MTDSSGADKMNLFTISSITALVCCLKNTKEHVNSYDTLMPLLLSALQNSPSETMSAMIYEGISYLAEAAGRDKFEDDFYRIVTVITPCTTTLPVSHPRFPSFLSTSDRLCQLMSAYSEPLLELFTNTCLRALRFPFKDDGTSESNRVIEAKSYAWNHLSYWAREERYIFSDHAPLLLRAIIVFIENEKEVLETMKYIQLFAYLLDAEEGIPGLRIAWMNEWNTLKRIIKEDKDKELTTFCIKTVAECVKVTKGEGLSEMELNEMGVMMKEVFESELHRREMENQNELNERIENRGGLLNQIINIILNLVTAEYPVHSIPYSCIMPVFFPLIEKCSNKHWGIRYAAILAQFAPDILLKYRDQSIPFLFQSLTDNRPEIRRCAANAFGHMAGSNHVELKEVAVASLDSICQLMYRDDARFLGECIMSTEDAISAVIKIMKYCDERIVGKERTDEILTRFLSWLPLSGQSKECVVIYTFLIDLLVNNHPSLIAEPNANSPRILFILTKAIHDEIFDEGELERRVKKCIREMARKSESLNEWIDRSMLNQEERRALEDILKNTTD